MDKTTQLEKTVKNRQKGPVLTSKGAFYSFFLWITHFFYSFNNSFNRTAKIFIQRIYSFKKDPKLSIQRIHSFKKDPKLFIQRIYSFKKIQNYSFKENIHSSEKCIIAQDYKQVSTLENKILRKLGPRTNQFVNFHSTHPT